MDDTNLATAITHLGAVPHGDGYAYYDNATQAWWASSARALAGLGAALQSKQPDAYSVWCSNSSGEQLPEGWEPGLELRPCQCSGATGATGPCGYQADARLAWLPEHRRESARAARGARPAAISQAVARGWSVLDVVADHVFDVVADAGQQAIDGDIEVAAWVRDDGRLDYGDEDAVEARQ